MKKIFEISKKYDGIEERYMRITIKERYVIIKSFIFLIKKNTKLK